MRTVRKGRERRRLWISPRWTPNEGPVPTERDMERDRELIEDALMGLPGGLPPRLAMYGVPTIVERIIGGRKRWSGDGRLLAFIQGDWYYVDPNDPDFMTVHVSGEGEGEAL